MSVPAVLPADLLKAISALAVIKVNWDEDEDYIANFVPIVADCIRRGEHEKISLPDTKALVASDFGLHIPQGALQTILGRMSRDGLLRRRHGAYERIPEALSEFDLGSEREDVVRQHNHLVGLLVDFAAGVGREWSEEQAERALLGYVEVLAEPVLGAVVDGEPVVELPEDRVRGCSCHQSVRPRSLPQGAAGLRVLGDDCQGIHVGQRSFSAGDVLGWPCSLVRC